MGIPSIGPGELILILIIALVVLGPGKLPDVASSLGKSVREFRKAATDVTEAGKLDTPASAQAAPVTPAAPIAAPPAPAASAEAGSSEPSPAADEDRSHGGTSTAGQPARDPNLS
jgi:sec-independent protein translocase protein TatA